jgi:hypothetical protein
VSDVVEPSLSSLSAFVVLVLEESGMTVDTTGLPSAETSASIAVAAEINVRGLAKESTGSRDVGGTPVGVLDAGLLLELAAGSKSAVLAHT